MPSTLLSKTIAKLPAKKDTPKAMTPSLANLCTKSLWKQSIEAGKAEELVAALRATPEGTRALVQDAAAHVTHVFAVNLAGGDGVNEGTCGYVPVTEETAWFFKLLAQYCPPPLDANPNHPLGGRDLRWDELSECVEWARSILENIDVKVARTCVMNAIDIEVPKRDEEGELVEEVTEWLDDNYDDWTDRFQEKFEALFDEGLLREKYLLTVADVDELSESGYPPKIQAVVTINLDNWG